MIPALNFYKVRCCACMCVCRCHARSLGCTKHAKSFDYVLAKMRLAEG